MNCSSGKVVFDTRSEAKMSARRIKSVGKGNREIPATNKHLRPYMCRECGWWHLFSIRRVKETVQ